MPKVRKKPIRSKAEPYPTGKDAQAKAKGRRRGAKSKKPTGPDFETSDVRLPDVGDMPSLIAALLAKFGDVIDEDAIVRTLDNTKTSVSLHVVYTHFNDAAKALRRPDIVQRGANPDIQLPNGGEWFAFTQKTVLAGVIREGDRQSATPNFENADGVHAERQLIAFLEKDLGEQLHTAKPAGRELVLTINNSPCEKCATKLAEFNEGQSYFARIIVNFANPYGSEEEYLEARRTLEAAGIIIGSFAPERYLSGPQRKKQSGRLGRAAERRAGHRHARKQDRSDISAYDSDEDGVGEERKQQ